MNWVIIGLDNSVVPVLRQTIIYTNDGFTSTTLKDNTQSARLTHLLLLNYT